MRDYQLPSGFGASREQFKANEETSSNLNTARKTHNKETSAKNPNETNLNANKGQVSKSMKLSISTNLKLKRLNLETEKRKQELENEIVEMEVKKRLKEIEIVEKESQLREKEIIEQYSVSLKIKAHKNMRQPCIEKSKESMDAINFYFSNKLHEDIAIYTDPNTKYQYECSNETNEWVSASNVQAKDGVKYSWDEENNDVWLPKN